MNDDLLLVGSIPLDTAHEVFRVFGPALGEHLRYLPDGEVGDRRFWIVGLAYRVFANHPELDVVQRPAPDDDGVENWQPRGSHDDWRFRVKPGVARVRFGDPGWRLGYARDAINSYVIFRQLKRDGLIPSHVSFQVSLPLTYSAIGLAIPDPEDQERVSDGMTAAIKAEVANIVEHIPNDELAIQFDLAVENNFTERRLAEGDLEGARAVATECAAPAEQICSAIPGDVALGYHSCFGTLDGWPTRQPKDLTGTVLLLNAVTAASGRKVDFVHFPTLGSSEASWFRPLKDLDVGGARPYVGAIHHLHGQAGLGGQLETVSQYLPEFGLAAPCGFGRAPERPGKLLTDEGGLPSDVIVAILDEHLDALKVQAALGGAAAAGS
jgi:hypothetical protein